MVSESWKALSKAHEVGIAVENWPSDSEETFALSHPEKPTMLGITQLLLGQSHVDHQILSPNPSGGLDAVGKAAKAKLEEIQKVELETKRKEDKAAESDHMLKVGVPSSAVGTSPLTSRRASAMATKALPMKFDTVQSKKNMNQIPTSVEDREQSATYPSDVTTQEQPKSPTIPRKRKMTLSDELAELPEDSLLRKTSIIGTTSAKLSYIVTKVVRHAPTSKILIFYDGDNTAFYLAQALEMLYINHRIYARTLDNPTRSAYVALFNSDPDIRVLLIDVACGALGLNLNAANIVLIVNPINRPGIEAQAIKRAHRIGQTKEVFVETLILEGTMEEQIFKKAKSMTRQQHVEAKELEDDAGIANIIQNAQILTIEPGESEGLAMFAKLDVPQQVFGRPGRDKYQHYLGRKEEKKKAHKKAKMRRDDKDMKQEIDLTVSTAERPATEGVMPPPEAAVSNGRLNLEGSSTTASQPITLSIFGGPPAY